MLFMLGISHPMTGIMAMGTCSWLRWQRADTDVPCGIGGKHGSSLFPLFVISAGSLDSSGTERDEMDTWFHESLIELFVPLAFLFLFQITCVSLYL